MEIITKKRKNNANVFINVREDAGDYTYALISEVEDVSSVCVRNRDDVGNHRYVYLHIRKIESE